MVSIIIPVLNQKEMTMECLRAIHRTVEGADIIIVDNGSDEAFHDPEHLVNKIIRNETNLGFPAAVNQGLDSAEGDIIVVMNNDVIVTHGWMEILTERLNNGLDMVGPVTNSISGPQQVRINIYNDHDSLEVAVESQRKAKEGCWYPYHRLVFFCVAFKREVYEKVGMLDEIFTPGNYEDDDFCMRAIVAGFKLGVAEDCYVHHYGSITHKALNLDYVALMRKNQKIFDDKWGELYVGLQKKNNG